jgi:SAM-dependent methyltransferase
MNAERSQAVTILQTDYQKAIEYRLTSEAWDGYNEFLRNLIVDHQVRHICDVGGGANPAVHPQLVEERDIEYLILDISESELKKAPPGYRTMVCDVTGARVPEGQFDLIVTRMLAEHVRNAAAFHRNIFRMLMPGGRAFHFFPTLYATPFIINRLLPDDWTRDFLTLLQPYRSRSGRRGKFPAYYQWCFGPTEKQFCRFNSIGFEVEKYIGFFGHGGYYRKVPPLRWMHLRKARWLMAHPIPHLTSFTFLVLRKPEEPGDLTPA